MERIAHAHDEDSENATSFPPRVPESKRPSRAALGLGACAAERGLVARLLSGDANPRPNIVICISDDQGWGDVSYNGHKEIKTPVLDEMAASGLRFDRFYAAAPVCSPTRGSVMTGRHPNRFGCFLYNYSIRPEEVTLAEALKRAGYATGHFGKWHLGPAKAGSPVSPGGCGFDEYLSHDNFFDLGPPLSRNGQEPRVHPGESSEVVVAVALEFISRKARGPEPFLAVVCFGSPHGPHKALEKDRAPYRHLAEKVQHRHGEIAAMDRAMGNLRQGLRDAGSGDDTLLWFFSDNGGVGPGSWNGGLKGKKGSLWEGGIRVPAVLEWPAGIRAPRRTAIPCCTTDVYPTVLDLIGLEVPNQVRPLDGISLRPLLEGRMAKRPEPLAFWKYPHKRESKNEEYLDAEALTGYWRRFRNFKHPEPRQQDFGGEAALIGNRYKPHLRGNKTELYDLLTDPQERRDLAAQQPDVVHEMTTALEAWRASVERSLSGEDYS